MTIQKKIKKRVKQFKNALNLLGINLDYFIAFIGGMPFYLKDLYQLTRQAKKQGKEFAIGKFVPCVIDRDEQAGLAKGHYFHQDLLVARRVFLNNPLHHVDIGSRIDGFIANVASFRKIEVMDIRKLDVSVPNIKFTQLDAMKNLEPGFFEYCDSLSSLHALEHFGLGRYGDPISYDGYKIGLENFYKILKSNGKLYLSVPMGKQRIEFNSQRVFSLNFLLDLLKEKFRIDQFSYVDDEGDLNENINLTEPHIKNNFSCHYGCAIFELTKVSS